MALTLVNRRQVSAGDFETTETGGVWLTEEGCKKVLVAYQKRKEDEIVQRGGNASGHVATHGPKLL